jgi:beta-galactosidase GanA
MKKPESYTLMQSFSKRIRYSLMNGRNSFMFMMALSVTLASAAMLNAQPRDDGIPHLVKHGTATQLVVDGKPFLAVAGELGNSSASYMNYLNPFWMNLEQMHLNTLLVPVYWELIEPDEGHFDFTLIDSIIHAARQHKLKIVFLWFGSWKNSMSCYAPLWVKTDEKRFPRARTKTGAALEILTPFNENSRGADARVFAALMKHVRKIDGKSHTVIMVQVENEIGMIPDARDYSSEADKAFNAAVPQELISYLEAHKDSLEDSIKSKWEENGLKTSGTWEEVFGQGLGTDELFMAWYFAGYTDFVAGAGKLEYPLPMYVNAALIRPGYEPGQYPSAGPLPHLFDVWKAAAPHLDFLAPDVYFPNFAEWISKFDRKGNPLFIPECQNTQSIANAYFAFAEHNAMGFSPFSIESLEDPQHNQVSQGYEVLHELTPLILENQGEGRMAGVLLDSASQEARIILGNYVFTVKHEYAWRFAKRESGPTPRVGGLIIMLSSDQFIIAGTGLLITFRARGASASSGETCAGGSSIAGIGTDNEGKFVDGKWVPGRSLNGDQTDQGRQVLLPGGEFSIQKVKLYNYY